MRREDKSDGFLGALLTPWLTASSSSLHPHNKLTNLSTWDADRRRFSQKIHVHRPGLHSIWLTLSSWQWRVFWWGNWKKWDRKWSKIYKITHSREAKPKYSNGFTDAHLINLSYWWRRSACTWFPFKLIVGSVHFWCRGKPSKKLLLSQQRGFGICQLKQCTKSQQTFLVLFNLLSLYVFIIPLSYRVSLKNAL